MQSTVNIWTLPCEVVSFSLEEGEGEGILTALDLVLAVVTGSAVVDSFRC